MAPRQLLTLFLVVAPFLFAGIGSVTFLDPDEGLYAEVPLEMVRSGDWITPRFNTLPYLEKPPLLYWLVSLTFVVAGPSEWGVRLWSALPAAGTVLLVWRLGLLLHGPTAAWLSGLVFATSVGTFLYIRKASTDFLLVFVITLTLWGFVRDAVRGTHGRGRYLVLYVGLALGVLTKGLIGVILPVAVIALTMRFAGLSARQLNLGAGLALFGLIALPWHVAMARADPDFLWFYLIDNQVLRFLNVRGFVEDDVPVTTVGFLLLLIVWFFPWSPFLPAAVREALPWRWRPGSERSKALPIFWALVVIGFFALSRSKLEYYALPAFPALSLLVGSRLATALGPPGHARALSGSFWLGLAGCLLAGSAAMVGAGTLSPERALAGLAELNVYYRILKSQGMPFPFEWIKPLAWLLGTLGVVLIVGWTAATVLWLRGWRRASLSALVGMAGGIATLIFLLLILVEPHHSVKAAAAAVMNRWKPGDRIVHEGPLEYSAALPFYTGQRIFAVNGDRGDLDLASRRPEASALFLDATSLAAAWQNSARLFLVTREPPGRSVAEALSPPILIGQYGGRRVFSNRDE